MTLLKAIDEIDFPFFLPVDTTIIERTYENTKNGEFFKTREVQKELTFRTPSKNDISVVSKEEFFWILIIILGMSALIIWLVRKMSSEQSDSVTKTENYLKKSTYKPARNERSPKKDKNSKISIKNQKPVASKPHARVNEELTLFATTSKDMELESNSQPKNDFLTSTINSPRISEEKKDTTNDDEITTESLLTNSLTRRQRKNKNRKSFKKQHASSSPQSSSANSSETEQEDEEETTQDKKKDQVISESSATSTKNFEWITENHKAKAISPEKCKISTFNDELKLDQIFQDMTFSSSSGLNFDSESIWPSLAKARSGQVNGQELVSSVVTSTSSSNTLTFIPGTKSVQEFHTIDQQLLKIMAKKFRSFSLMEVEQAYKEVLHAFKVEECSRMTIPQWQMMISDKLFKVEELSDDIEVYMSDEDEEDNVEALNESDVDECLICFELLMDNLGYLASCGHVFHRDCIKKWMDKSVNCPKCRAVY